MQLIHSKKPKKESQAQQFARILAGKWRVQDKMKAEEDVKILKQKNVL